MILLLTMMSFPVAQPWCQTSSLHTRLDEGVLLRPQTKGVFSTSVSVCTSHYIHSAAPSHQLWWAFTWVDRWLSCGSTLPNRGALTCQLSVRPQNQLCHVISSTPITVTHQVCVRKRRRRLQFNTTRPGANGKNQAIITRQRWQCKPRWATRKQLHWSNFWGFHSWFDCWRRLKGTLSEKMMEGRSSL